MKNRTMAVVLVCAAMGMGIGGCASKSRGLNRAARNGTLEDMQRALAEGGNVNQQGESNNRPLHEAALYNNAIAAQFLIDHGANINVGDEDEDTPLHMAAQRG